MGMETVYIGLGQAASIEVFLNLSSYLDGSSVGVHRLPHSGCQIFPNLAILRMMVFGRQKICRNMQYPNERRVRNVSEPSTK